VHYTSYAPHSLECLYATGDGSYHALETSRKGAESESSVVFWEPGNEEVDNRELTDADFASFALRKISEAISRLEKQRQV
jgi:hypothetical protein